MLTRFNKAQQDSFLPHVENGDVTFIGATTENPSFSINSALLSRCKIIVLKKLPVEAIESILHRGIKVCQAEERMTPEAIEYLTSICDGDARSALTFLQVTLDSVSSDKRIDLSLLKETLNRSHVLYDRKGDEHYNCASALQKSIRGSDDNAALYWSMRMLEGGEDPMFIARRLVRIASEDVGLGDNAALPMAVATMQVGEARSRTDCVV